MPKTLTSNLRALAIRFKHNTLLWWSVGLVTVWRILLEIVNQVVAHVFYHQSPNITNLNYWAGWDGGWYLSINNPGYEHLYGAMRQGNVAFFPAFPEIVSFLSRLLHIDYVYVGLALNFLLTIGLVYIFMKLAQLLISRFAAASKHQNTIVLVSALALLAYPSSFFLAAYYAEALLIFTTVSAIYYTLKGKLLWAVPFLAVGTASKVTGTIVVAVCMAIVLEQWWTKKQPWRMLAKGLSIISLGLSGLLAYMTYLWVSFGDPLLFYKIQKLWGRNDDQFFLSRLWNDYYMHFFDPVHFKSKFIFLVYLFVMILPFIVAAGAWLTWRKYKILWPTVLVFLTLALPLSTGMMESLNRYCLVLAPLIPLVVIWAYTKFKPIVLYSLLVLSGITMLVFAHGFFRQGLFAG